MWAGVPSPSSVLPFEVTIFHPENVKFGLRVYSVFFRNLCLWLKWLSFIGSTLGKIKYKSPLIILLYVWLHNENHTHKFGDFLYIYITSGDRKPPKSLF